MDTSVKVNEMELISRLVDGLPEEYDMLIIGLVRGIETITFDEFVQILESKCSLSKWKGGATVAPSTAVAGATFGQRFNGRCFKCNKVGHRSVDCDDYLAGSTLLLKENVSGNGGPSTGKGSEPVDLDTLIEGNHDPGGKNVVREF
jgi:hypothetical protein